MRSITILFVLMMASVVQAQALAVKTLERSCDPNGCRQFIGKGTCAYIGNSGDRSVYITAAHVVNDAVQIHVGYGGKWWGAVVVHKVYEKANDDHDDNIDYAIIETRKIPSDRCFQLSGLFPESGVGAKTYGYSNGFYNRVDRSATIRIRGNLRGVRQSVDRGESGGPVVVDGKVVGIMNAVTKDDGMTICTPSNLIRMEVMRRYRIFPNCGCSPRKVVVVPPVQIQPEPIPPLDGWNPGIEPKPDPLFIDNTNQVNALEVEIGQLKAEIDKLNKTQIPVWIIGADGEPVAKQTYPLGDPIKLRFKALKSKAPLSGAGEIKKVYEEAKNSVNAVINGGK